MRITKSRIVIWAGHVALIREKRNAYKLLVGEPEGRYHLEDQDVGWQIIFRPWRDKIGWYGLD
jgi:hypothetical protein